MRLQIIPKIGERPIVLEAAMVVINTDGGKPIGFAAIDGATVEITHAGDADFLEILDRYGIDRTGLVIKDLPLTIAKPPDDRYRLQY